MQEYYEKLCKKFPEITFNTGSSLMSGNENKVVINISSECLKKVANDPEFAKKVEFNLTGAVPGQNRMFAQAKADNAVIHGYNCNRCRWECFCYLRRYDKNQWFKTKFNYIECGKETKRKIIEKA